MTITRRRLPALLGVLALAACGRPGATTPAVAAPSPPPGWLAVAQIEAGRTTGPVTIGGAWAFIPNTSDGTVTQVERSTGRIVATIAVSDPRVLREQGCAPDSVHAYHSASWGWRACDTPYAIAWDGSSLWAIDNGLKRLVRVDPRRHRVVAAVDLRGTGWALAADAGTVFVSGWDDDSVYKVDVASARLAGTLTGLDQGPSSLALAGGSLWVVCARGTGELLRLDPDTLSSRGRYQIEWWSLAAAAYQDALYVRGTNGGDVSRLDTASGAIDWSRAGPGFIGRNGIDEIAATPEGVWVGGTTTELLDRATGGVLEDLRLPSMAVAAEGRELWVSRMDGSVWELRRR